MQVGLEVGKGAYFMFHLEVVASDLKWTLGLN